MEAIRLTARKRRLPIVIALAVVMVLAAACGSSSPKSSSANTTSSSTSAKSSSTSASSTAGKVLHVGFIYIGSITDGSWNQLWDTYGRKYIQQTFGSRVQVDFKQNVPLGPPATQAAESLINGGDTLIIATSGGYEQYLKPVAVAHPKVQFEQFETTYTAPNYHDFDVNIAQPAYIAGMMLAAAAKKNEIGLVEPFPEPALVTVVNAIELGAQAINPNMKTKVIFISSFFDPSKETLSARALAAGGAGALASSVDDPSVCVYAQKVGLPCASEQLTNGPSFGPTTFLVSWLYVWKPFMHALISSVLAGKPIPEYPVYSWDQGGVGLGALGKSYNQLVPAADRTKIKKVETELKNGTFNVYTGPIKDQSGAVRVPAGQKLTPKQNLAISYAVQGVVPTVKVG